MRGRLAANRMSPIVAGMDLKPLVELARMAEAIVFASAEPVSDTTLAARLPEGSDVAAVMAHLRSVYAGRGVNLLRVGEGWAFRTASDLAFLLARDASQLKKLSRAALEVLAIIAYHQPATRADIESIRGVETSKGTLDLLLETQWIRIRGRRRTPGRPVTYATTEAFLDHFQLDELGSLPGLDELTGAGLLASGMPPDLLTGVPPDPGLIGDGEDALTDIDLEELGLLTPVIQDE